MPNKKLPQLKARRIQRTRAPLPDELRAQIAVDRFSSATTTGKFIAIGKLAKKYGRAPAVISRAIPKAFHLGLVEVRKTADNPPVTLPKRIKALEQRLLERFPNLNHAIVIKTGEFSGNSDRVHEMLGIAMAEFIALGSVIQNGSAIGVGSGRGVTNVVRNLSHFPPLRQKGVSLFSLTGSVYSSPNQQALRMWDDADKHVIQLARHFIHEPDQYLICHPLAYAAKELQDARRRTWLRTLDGGSDGSHHGKAVPRLTHLLVGVGTVREEHRFYKEARAKVNDQEPFLRPIHKLLAELADLCDSAVVNLKKDVPSYRPCADVSNFFLYVPPPEGKSIPEELESKIQECIKKLNGRLLNGLSNIPRGAQFLVVAGTEEKSHAVKALLQHPEYQVAYLCSEERLALDILEGKT